MDKINDSLAFNRRAFVSIGMIICTLILPVSGIMNHQLQFEELTQARHFWMSVHNLAGTLFIIFAFTHILLNWRAIKNYILQKQRLLFSKESFFAVLFVGGIVFLFALHAFHAG